MNQWRGEVEAWTSKGLGLPVRIGELSVRGDLWAPTVVVRDLRMLRPDGQTTALQLADVEAVITPGSLLPRSLSDWRPHLRRLTLHGLDLSLQRDAAGRWQVDGLPTGASRTQADGNRVFDWLLQQGEIVVRQGTLELADVQTGATPVRLDAVDLQWRNRLGRHTLTLSARPPAEWGAPLQARIELREPLLAAAGLWRRGDWSRWRTELSVDLPAGALAGWQALLQPSLTGWRWQGGVGRLALQLSRDQGEWQGASLDVDLHDTALAAPANAAPLRIAHLAGRLSARLDTQALQLDARALQLQLAGQTPGSAAAAPASLQLRWALGPAESHPHTLRADGIDLGTLAALAPNLALPPPWSNWLAASRPAGRLHDLRLQWRGPPAAPLDWQASGRVQALSLQPVAAPAGASAPGAFGLPGVSAADLRFSATPAGGQADVALRAGWLAVPGAFEDERLPLERLSGEVRWRLLPGAPVGTQAAAPVAVEVAWRHVQVANADLKGESSGRWQTRLPGAAAGAAAGATAGTRPSIAAGGATAPANWAAWPGQIDLQASVVQADATRVHRYLPLLLPVDVRHYVRDAVRAGQISGLTAQVSGALHDFPFADPTRGRFEIAGQVSGVTLDYLPASLIGDGVPWPRFSQLDGELRFERQGMVLRRASARLADSGRGEAMLSQVEGGIADLAHAPQLTLGGRVLGPLDDLLHYVNHSPIGGWLSGALADMSGSGPAAVELKLAIPLLDTARTSVAGRLELRGNAVQLGDKLPRLADVRGDLAFTEQTFTLRPTTVRALGGSARIQGGMDARQPLRLSASGTASAEGLRQAAQAMSMASPARALSGETPYQLQIAFDHGQPQVTIDSPLTGMALQLPAPLGKSAEATWPLRLMVGPATRPAASSVAGQGVNAAAGTAAADGTQRWTLRLADRLAARWQSAPGDGLPASGWLQIGDAVREAAPSGSDKGWQVSIATPELSIDAWSAWLDRLNGGKATAGSTTPGTPDAPPALDALREVTARVGLLEWQGRQLHQLDARLRQGVAIDGRRWDADVQATELSGRLEVHLPRSGDQVPQVHARLAKLILSPPDREPSGIAEPPAAPVEALTAGTSAAPPNLPDLDVEVEQFTLRKRSMGRLVLHAGHRPALGGGRRSRDWQIDQLTLQTADARLSATGLWQAPAAGPANAAGAGHASGNTRLNFKLDIDDSGALLAQLGWPGTVKGGHGKLSGQIGWPGTPFEPSVSRLGGHLNIALSSGRFLQADPGAARLLGILSLQSLPRRFLLNFRDLFQQGFGFDQIDGDVDLQLGLAHTRNLRLRGAQAMVLTEGQADLHAETQDLQVWIVPEIDAGAASLAYAIVNPAIGLGTLIGQWFLRKPLAEAATREFHIGGSWDDPTVTPIARANVTPAPRLAPLGEAAASQPTAPP